MITSVGPGRRGPRALALHGWAWMHLTQTRTACQGPFLAVVRVSEAAAEAEHTGRSKRGVSMFVRPVLAGIYLPSRLFLVTKH
jgi:hypothetical protein